MDNTIYMIASDLHGSAYYTDQLVDAFHREGADRLLLCAGHSADAPDSVAQGAVLSACHWQQICKIFRNSSFPSCNNPPLVV